MGGIIDKAHGGVPSREILGTLKLLLVVSRSSMGQLYRNLVTCTYYIEFLTCTYRTAVLKLEGFFGDEGIELKPTMYTHTHIFDHISIPTHTYLESIQLSPAQPSCNPLRVETPLSGGTPPPLTTAPSSWVGSSY